MKSFHQNEGLPLPQTLKIPDNVLLIASHAPRELPPNVNPLTGEQAYELSPELSGEHGDAFLRDFSDYGTGLILDEFPRQSVVTPRWGRIAGDPNRPPSFSITGDPGIDSGQEAFRDTTMGGVIPVWKKPPDSFMRAVWEDENHRTYYEQIMAKILTKLEEIGPDKPLLVVDLHDTGDVRLMPDGSAIPVPTRVAKYGRSEFWNAIISDVSGKSARPGVTEAFTRAVKEVYGERGIDNSDEEVRVNFHYLGGYATKFAGIYVPEQITDWGIPGAERISAIQLEIPRHRFMPDERTQKVDPEQAHQEALMLQEILFKAVKGLDPVKV